jgi:hypothetical protein
VLTGRLVENGTPVAGRIRIAKAFTNELSPGNPINEVDWPETIASEIETEPDGTFRWVVYPSTQPYEEYLGNQELIVVRGETGDEGSVRSQERQVFLTRGDVLDLGDIAVS